MLEVVAAFSDQLQRKVSAETVDRGDVRSEQREERGANVESQGVHLIGSVSTPRRWNCPVITTAMDTMEAPIQDLQRVKVPITAWRIHKRTGPSVMLDEIRQYAAQRFAEPKE